MGYGDWCTNSKNGGPLKDHLRESEDRKSQDNADREVILALGRTEGVLFCFETMERLYEKTGGTFCAATVMHVLAECSKHAHEKAKDVALVADAMRGW